MQERPHLMLLKNMTGLNLADLGAAPSAPPPEFGQRRETCAHCIRERPTCVAEHQVGVLLSIACNVCHSALGNSLRHFTWCAFALLDDRSPIGDAGPATFISVGNPMLPKLRGTVVPPLPVQAVSLAVRRFP